MDFLRLRLCFRQRNFQTVQGIKPTGVQSLFADYIHSYITEGQKTVTVLQEVLHRHSKHGPVDCGRLVTINAIEIGILFNFTAKGRVTQAFFGYIFETAISLSETEV